MFKTFSVTKRIKHTISTRYPLTTVTCSCSHYDHNYDTVTWCNCHFLLAKKSWSFNLTQKQQTDMLTHHTTELQSTAIQ